MLHPTGSDPSQPPEAAHDDAPEAVAAVAETPAPAAAERTPRFHLDPAWRAGRKLQAAREQLGLSIETVEKLTRVRREFLEALEDMDVKQLPGKAYALAYLRSYVKVLGLETEDEDKDIVRQYLREVALSREDARPQVRDPASRPRTVRPWVPVLALSVAAAGLIGWQAVKSNFLPPDPVSAAEAAPRPGGALVPAQAESAPAAPAMRRDYEIRALMDSHLEARGPDGTVYFYGDLLAGQTYRPDPGPGWALHAPNGAAFEVVVDGVSVGPLGEAGKPVLGRRLDEIGAAPATHAR